MAVKSATAPSKTLPKASGKQAVKAFVARLAQDYPEVSFKPGKREHWSSRSKTITYNPDQDFQHLRYGLLHELAHGKLGHTDYRGDFELLRMEAEAWETAANIGKKYNIILDKEHIQNCLDTYRDWLHRRSACPGCGSHAMQKDITNYHCFNCQTQWRVSSGRFVRPYRKTLNPKTTG